MTTESNGIDVEYALSSTYFEVGAAYQLHLGVNDFKVGLLTKYSKDSVTFTILKEGKIEDLTLSLEQLLFNNYGIIKMIPDFEDGKFSNK